MSKVFTRVTLVFFVGLALGVGIGYLNLTWENRYLLFDESPKDSVDLFHNRPEERNTTSADVIARRVKVLCWVPIPPERKAEARLIKETWGKRCDVLLFTSTVRGKTGKSKLGHFFYSVQRVE